MMKIKPRARGIPVDEDLAAAALTSQEQLTEFKKEREDLYSEILGKPNTQLFDVLQEFLPSTCSILFLQLACMRTLLPTCFFQFPAVFPMKSPACFAAPAFPT
jgi:hypothetical protein